MVEGGAILEWFGSEDASDAASDATIAAWQ